ncbi:hypothetical protein KEM56_000640 [Ascosphaera pollenicola]|nr:hypothetical protein KEM56_000640 [Ascosphaera pollenicola]
METASAHYRLPIIQTMITPFQQHVLFELTMGKVVSFCPGPNFYLTVTSHRNMRQRVGFRKLASASTVLSKAHDVAPVTNDASQGEGDVVDLQIEHRRLEMFTREAWVGGPGVDFDKIKTARLLQQVEQFMNLARAISMGDIGMIERMIFRNYNRALRLV